MKKFNINKVGNVISYHKNKPILKRKLMRKTKKDKDIIYGQRSMNAQIPNFMTRRTVDYDIFTKNPKRAAHKMQKKFDKVVGSNQFYAKKALHPGTHKVMHIGPDMKKGTKDDLGVIDYSKKPRPCPRYKVINGVRYRVLTQEEQAKLKALRDPKYKFRHKKDREGLISIRQHRRIFRHR